MTVKTFLTCQQTRRIVGVWDRPNTKASSPAFNVRDQVFAHVEHVNQPCFSPETVDGVMSIIDELRTYGLERHGIRLPTKAFNDLRGYADKYHDRLTQANMPRCAGFVKAYQTLSIVPETERDWRRFLEDQGVTNVTGANLHKNVIARALFDEDDSGLPPDVRDKTLSWLSKFVNSWSVNGCLTDVVNAVAAMTSNDSVSETDLRAFAQRLRDKRYGGLWIPSELVHDAELDDIIVYVMLRKIHDDLGTRLDVTVQLPEPGPDVTSVMCLWRRLGCCVTLDPDSKNWDKVVLASVSYHEPDAIKLHKIWVAQ